MQILPDHACVTHSIGATRHGLSQRRGTRDLDAVRAGGEPTPIPTQIVSSDEYYPDPQNARQREVEARLLAMAEEFGATQGIPPPLLPDGGRHGRGVRRHERNLRPAVRRHAGGGRHAGDGAGARRRAKATSSSWTCTRISCATTRGSRASSTCGRRWARPAGTGLVGKEQTIEDLKFDNYFKEIYLDSDTKIALHSSARLRRSPQDWFLTNEMMAAAREKVNDEAGLASACSAPRHLHPGPAGLDGAARLRASTLKPDSFKGYTIGDNTHKDLSRYPWRMDDEKLLYPALREDAQGGHPERLRAQGTVSAVASRSSFRNLRGYADVRDVGQAAKDWPQLNFIIYHSAYRHVGGRDPAEDAWRSSSGPDASSG